MTSINTGSGSAHGSLGGAYQDEQGWEMPEETPLEETPAEENSRQAMLKLEQQVIKARDKTSAKMAERAKGEGKLENIFGAIGTFSGMVAGPLLIMNCMYSEGREIVAGLVGIPVGGIAGGFAGRYLGKFINYLRRGSYAEKDSAESSAPVLDSNREDDEEDGRTPPVSHYWGGFH